jgi:hypothetical protein
MGTGSFPAAKRPGRDVDLLLPYSAEVKERVDIHRLPLWAFVACSRLKFTFYLFVLRVSKLRIAFVDSGKNLDLKNLFEAVPYPKMEAL